MVGRPRVSLEAIGIVALGFLCIELALIEEKVEVLSHQ